MIEKRRFLRFDLAMPVVLRRGNREETLVTGDISRHGAFIRTDRPCRERDLVQLRFMPEGEPPLDAMCMVVRVLDHEGPNGPGMGVDFFALSRESKDRWDRWVIALQRGEGAAVELGAMPSVIGESLPVKRRDPRERACFLVRMNSDDDVRDFMTRDVSRGGMFIETTAGREVGERITLVLVHPVDHDEFELSARVARVADDGMGVQFVDLDDARLAELEAFFDTGVRALNARDMPELEKLMAAEAEAQKLPDEPDVLEALGHERLMSGDLAGAVEVLTLAVLQAPSMVSIHEKLANAYYQIGDKGRGRAHERVALALSLYKVEVAGV